MMMVFLLILVYESNEAFYEHGARIRRLNEQTTSHDTPNESPISPIHISSRTRSGGRTRWGMRRRKGGAIARPPSPRSPLTCRRKARVSGAERGSARCASSSFSAPSTPLLAAGRPPVRARTLHSTAAVPSFLYSLTTHSLFNHHTDRHRQPSTTTETKNKHHQQSQQPQQEKSNSIPRHLSRLSVYAEPCPPEPCVTLVLVFASHLVLLFAGPHHSSWGGGGGPGGGPGGPARGAGAGGGRPVAQAAPAPPCGCGQCATAAFNLPPLAPSTLIVNRYTEINYFENQQLQQHHQQAVHQVHQSAAVVVPEKFASSTAFDM
ncbi:hypothetical protein GWI33_015825, partial [Rhynchophorus ferrugineus]